MLKLLKYNTIICVIIILCLTLYPVVAESATGNISGKIVSSSSTTKSNSTPPSSERGGGGGWGGPPLFNSTFSNAFVTSKYIYTPGKEIPLKLSKIYTNATDITGISIVVDGPLYIDFRFANVIKLPNIEIPKNAYRVYEFVFTKFGTRTKVEPKNVTITFRVPNDWVKKPEDMKLFEYKNNSWIEHPTEMLGVNGSFTYYKSSFNRSGFYYLGYPEINGSALIKNQPKSNKPGLNQTNTTNKSSTEVNTGSLNLNQSVHTNQTINQTNFQSQNLVNPSNALQESLIGDILNDILNFISNLIQSIRGLFNL